MADAIGLGCVVEHVGGEESVAERLHVKLGAMQVAVDFGEIQQVEGDLVL